jgi:hypothetical protein
MTMKASEENLAEQKKAESLPEGNGVPSKDRWYQNIP